MIEVPSPAAPSRAGSNVMSVVLVVAALVAVGGLAFAIGRATAPAATSSGAIGAAGPGTVGTGANGLPDRASVPGAFGALGSGELTLRGTVEALSATNLTLKLADGSTVEILLDDTTTYHRQADAASSDVTTGSSVLVGVAGFNRADRSPAPNGTPDPNRTPTPAQSPSLGPAVSVTLVNE